MQEYLNIKLAKNKKELLDAMDTLAAAVEEGNKENILEAARIITEIAEETNEKMDDLRTKYHIFLKDNNV